MSAHKDSICIKTFKILLHVSICVKLKARGPNTARQSFSIWPSGQSLTIPEIYAKSTDLCFSKC